MFSGRRSRARKFRRHGGPVEQHSGTAQETAGRAQVAGRRLPTRKALLGGGGQSGHGQTPPGLRIAPTIPRGRGVDAAAAWAVLADGKRAQRRSRSALVARPVIPRRFAAMAGLLVAPVALGIVVVAGVVTPGYAPLTRTPRPLAGPGIAAARAVPWVAGVLAPAPVGLAVAPAPREIIRPG